MLAIYYILTLTRKLDLRLFEGPHAGSTGNGLTVDSDELGLVHSSQYFNHL